MEAGDPQALRNRGHSSNKNKQKERCLGDESWMCPFVIDWQCGPHLSFVKHQQLIGAKISSGLEEKG